MPNSKNSKRIFRELAISAIEKSHSAIKGCWLVVFAGGTFALIQSFNQLLVCANIFSGVNTTCWAIDVSNWFSWSFSLRLGFYLVYILTFYRFYVGNVRYFDIRFGQFVEFIGSVTKDARQQLDNSAVIDNEREKEVDEAYQFLFDELAKNTNRENIFLIGVTLLIVLLTVQVNYPASFLSIYFFIMISDLVWMYVLGPLLSGHWIKPWIKPSSPFRDRFEKEFPLLLQQSDIGEMFPDYAVSVWRPNNFCTALSLLSLLALWFWQVRPYPTVDPALWLWLGLLVALGNCIYDLWYTRRFYNPQFGAAYEKLTVGMTR